ALPGVDVADVAELPVDDGADARLLEHLADRGLGAALARVDQALRERPDLRPIGLSPRPHNRCEPPAAQAADDDPARGELTAHVGHCRPFGADQGSKSPGLRSIATAALGTCYNPVSWHSRYSSARTMEVVPAKSQG